MKKRNAFEKFQRKEKHFSKCLFTNYFTFFPLLTPENAICKILFFLHACSKKTYFGVRNFNLDAFILQFHCVEIWNIGSLRYNKMSLYVV